MLKPERMSKLFVVGPKSVLNKIVSRLHELKVAHIIEHKKDEFELGAPLENFEKISSLLVQVRSLTNHLDIKADEAELKLFNLKKLEKEISRIKDEVNEVIEKTKEAEDGINILSEQEKLLELMSLLNINPESFQRSSYIIQFFGYIKDEKIKQKLENITDRFEIKTAKHEKNTLIAVFADSDFNDKFAKILADASFSEIDVSSVKELKGNPKELKHQISKKHETHESQLKTQNIKLKNLSKKHSQLLAEAEKFLSIEAEKAQIPLSFGSTREAFFLKCYLPENDIDKTKEELIKISKNKLYIVEESLGSEEVVPIKLKNNKYIKNFEFFTRLFALPKYSEFDPSVLMAYTFPLFFGFMLGDIGYGLVTFALFYWLRKKFPVGRDFFSILLAASVSAMIFGVLYGEVFGYEPWHGLIVRTEEPLVLFYISIIAGLVQVNFGLLLGFVLEYNEHGFLKAAYEKLSWVILQIGGVLFLGPLLGLLSLPALIFYIGLLLFIIAAFMLKKGEGYVGLMEIPTILTHIVSYARLMGVGLASVFIAVMINNFTTFLLHKSLLFVPLALIVLFVGHLFNIALGILSPSLHSIRLHYVEFFYRFYKGGGIEYQPFGAEKQKSLI